MSEDQNKGQNTDIKDEQLNDGPEKRVHLAGKRTIREKVQKRTVIFAYLFDILLTATALLMASYRFSLNPAPALVALGVFTTVSLWLIPHWFLNASPGTWIFRIRKSKKSRLPTLKDYETVPRSRFSWAPAYALTLLLAFATVSLTYRNVLSHPIYKDYAHVSLKPFYPDMDEDRDNWIAAPFFYSLAAWPKSYNGAPILISLPYLKGPPKRFVGKLIARWQTPGIRLTIEGPKTATHFEGVHIIKECFESRSACFEMRYGTIERHLSEMRRIGNRVVWDARWFEVKNEGFSESDHPQGVHLTASTPERIQERYILINSRGSHQTLILDRPSAPDSTHASLTVQKIVRSMRLAKDLVSGRALIDEQLSSVSLDELPPKSEPIEYISRLAEIQTLLLSKISVDPRTLETYFHLGGIANLIRNFISQVRVEQTQDVQPKVLSVLDDWSVSVDPLIRNAYLYAKDVNPRHPKTSKLEKIWEEVKSKR